MDAVQQVAGAKNRAFQIQRAYIDLGLAGDVYGDVGAVASVLNVAQGLAVRVVPRLKPRCHLALLHRVPSQMHLGQCAGSTLVSTVSNAWCSFSLSVSVRMVATSSCLRPMRLF